MTSADEVRADMLELETLLGVATRPTIKALLQREIDVRRTAAAAPPVTGLPVERATQPATRPVNYLTNYAWDQSDKFMKIYVTLNGVHKLDKDSVTSTFTDRSFRLLVQDSSQAKDQCVHVKGLEGSIVPGESKHTVKSDMVVVWLRKSETKTWPQVIEKADKKKKETPKMDDNKDPSAGLMDLMKQMYEDGDDEMKRTIAKAWTESRDKKEGGMPGMPPM